MGKETRERLEKCWDEEITWDLYSKMLKEVKLNTYLVTI